MVCDFLATTYWGKDVPRKTTERSIANSLCFGVYEEGKQIAFARVVTDKAILGYLSDVFVLPEHRGKGISKALMASILEHPDVRDLQVFLLRTRDAHRLYSMFGFGPLPRPEEMMGRYT
jgi:GNAT superfamily N-acetyltransferase